MIFAKVLITGWMLVGASLMGSDAQEKKAEAGDWTGCDACTTTLLAVEDKRQAHQKYLQ